MVFVEKVLEQHEDMIDKHEDKLEKIQSDLTDIKVRLGIKDKTNGQVVLYQKELIKAQEEEITNRKENDALIRDDLKKLDDRVWYLAIGVLLSVILEIGTLLLR